MNWLQTYRSVLSGIGVAVIIGRIMFNLRLETGIDIFERFGVQNYSSGDLPKSGTALTLHGQNLHVWVPRLSYVTMIFL